MNLRHNLKNRLFVAKIVQRKRINCHIFSFDELENKVNSEMTKPNSV